MSNARFVPLPRLRDVFRRLVERYTVIAPVKDESLFVVMKKDSLHKLRINNYRLDFPFKLLFLPPKETMFEYENGRFVEPEVPTEGRRVIYFGLKSCDLKAIETLDEVFFEEPADTYYESRRENAILFASDCTDTLPTCFCTGMDLKPYPESGYDLNLSPIKEGYIVEFGSKKGVEILADVEALTRKVTDEQLNERKLNRNTVLRKLMKIRPKDFRDRVATTKENYWEELSTACVECMGCTNICPTCYCFYISDEKENETWTRSRGWDSCLSEAFQKVAAGLNPRETLSSRLRNRFYHKFVHHKDRYGEYACCGCGRCIEVCLGDVDIRKVLGLR